MFRSLTLLVAAISLSHYVVQAVSPESECGLQTPGISRTVKLSIVSKKNSTGDWVDTFSARTESSNSSDEIAFDLTHTVTECAGTRVIHIKGISGDNLEESIKEGLFFHPRCGKNVAISQNGRTVSKINLGDPLNTAVFTNRPLKNNEMFEMRVDKKISESGYSLGIGVITQTPTDVQILPEMWKSPVSYIWHHTSVHTNNQAILTNYGRNLNGLQIFIALSILDVSSAFNLDVRYPIVFEDPSDDSERGSYFGYSVLLYNEKGRNKSWIQIGAPRANSTTHSEIVEPGVAYRCPLWPLGLCRPLLLDNSGNERQSVGDTEYIDRKDGAWIGATMDVQPGPGGRVVICGPRWINQVLKDEYNQIGVCYWMPAEDYGHEKTEDQPAEKLIPLINKDRRVFTLDAWKGKSVYDFGVGEAGMSVHMPLKKTIEEKSELLLGAPGLLNWRGGSILYEDGSNFQGGGYNKRSIPIDAFSNTYLPEPDLSYEFKDFDYLGYQVNSGYFFDKNELLYVASAPRAVDTKGKVLIFNLVKKQKKRKYETKLKVKVQVQGIQCGEYFGASLAVGDLNGDGYDDLIVGSPLYTKEDATGIGYDEGKVSVFLGGFMNMMIQTEAIIGEVKGARFGSAISYLGDLDSDGFPEVGVGAPYEDNGRGVVYIYASKTNGYLSEAIQRLTARSTHEFLRGFGSSITPHTADVDQNGCPDLTVGAHVSGHAVIYRGRPVVRWEISPPKPNPKHIPHNATDFTLESSCVTYLGRNAPQNLEVWRIVEMDSNYLRCHVANSRLVKELIPLTRGETFCENLTIHMKPKIQNFLNPVEVYIRYQLKEEKDFEDLHGDKERPEFKVHPIVVKENEIQGKDNFCKFCPISHGPSKTEVIIPFEVGCGKDNICHADLSIKGQLPQLDKGLSAENLSFVIGSFRTLMFKVLVSNKDTAEPAYHTHVYLEIGSPAKISRIPPACNEISAIPFLENIIESSEESHASSSSSSHSSMSHGTTAKRHEPYLRKNISSINLSCDLDNPLRPKSDREVLIELDMTDIHGSNVMELSAWATTISNEINPSDNSWYLLLPLKIEADIAMAGNAVKELHTYFKESKNESDSNITFLHSYEVQKFGFSPIEKVNIELQIPVSVKNKGFKNVFLTVEEFQGFQGGQPLSCIVKNDDDNSGDGIPKDPQSTYSIPLDDINAKISEVPSNRTLYINCSSSTKTKDQLFSCMSITCAAGPFINSLSVAKVLLTMKINIKALQPLMGKRDIILLATQGYARIIEPLGLKQPKLERPDYALPYTLFIGDIPEKEVESWVLALAIGGGIMILLFLAMALSKAGFFERKKKEELKALKRQTILEVGDDTFKPDEQEMENSH